MKLLKSLLIPTLAISTLTTVATISTSCGSEDGKKDSVIHVTSIELDRTALAIDLEKTITLHAIIHQFCDIQVITIL